MTVKRLIKHLQKLDQEARVYVSAEGYNNYCPDVDDYELCDETTVCIVDGKIFIADQCHIELY